MAETVGIVIPAYNAERFIDRTLDAVRSQSRFPDEVVVVDDGSADKTAERVAEWSHRSGFSVKVIRQQNGGASSARNAGIQAASTDLIATLDADDIISPHHLATLKRGFEIEPELILCFADATVHSETGIIRESFLRGSDIEQMEYEVKEDLRVIRGSAFIGIVGGNRIPTSSTMFRRRVALEAGLYDTKQKQCNDTEFLLRLSRLGRFGYFDVPINAHQRHGTNLTHPRHRVANRKFRIQMLRKMLNNRQQLQLSAAAILKTQTALDRAIQSLLTHAAGRGLLTYGRISLELVRHGSLQPLAKPGNLLRALRASTFSGHSAA